jgi:hypothetical protein
MPVSADRLDGSGFDELAQRRLWDADVTADPGEPDAPFCDETSREPGLGAEDVGGLIERQEPVSGGVHVLYRFSFSRGFAVNQVLTMNYAAVSPWS